MDGWEAEGNNLFDMMEMGWGKGLRFNSRRRELELWALSQIDPIIYVTSIPQAICRLIPAPFPVMTYFRDLSWMIWDDTGRWVESTPRPKNRNIVCSSAKEMVGPVGGRLW